MGRLFLSCEAVIKVLVSVAVPPPGGTVFRLLIAAPGGATWTGAAAPCQASGSLPGSYLSSDFVDPNP